MMTIAGYGGYWQTAADAGIACRHAYAEPTASWNIVASSTVEILILYGLL